VVPADATGRCYDAFARPDVASAHVQNLRTPHRRPAGDLAGGAPGSGREVRAALRPAALEWPGPATATGILFVQSAAHMR
jgi:hypothetical protein